MMVRLRCACGESFWADGACAGGAALCPKCGRLSHLPSMEINSPAAEPPPVVPPLDETGEDRRTEWLVIAGALTAVLLIGLALMWAILALSGSGPGTGGSGGAGDGGTGTAAAGPGKDPYAGRAREGDGSGAGEAAAGDGAKAPAQPPQPVVPPIKEPPPAFRDVQKTPPPVVPPPVVPPELPPAAPSPLANTGAAGTKGAGPYGQRGGGGGGSGGGGGDRTQARKLGASKESEDAVDRGLQWLAKVQEDDGRWDAAKWDGSHDLGCSGLATLAFLADGHTHKKGKYKATVEKSIKWLLSQMDKDGRFKYQTFYEQGIGAMALCEAYGMTGDASLRRPAQKAIDVIIQSAGADGGYGYGGPGDDISVTGFQIMALKSALMSKLDVPQAAIDREKAYLNACGVPDGWTGYGKGGGRSLSRTAVNMFCRLFLGYGRKEDGILKMTKIIHEAGPAVGNKNPNDPNDLNDLKKRLGTRGARNLTAKDMAAFATLAGRVRGGVDPYYTYYATYAMLQMGDPYWREWNAKFRDPVIAMQVRDGSNLDGSWGSEGIGGMITNGGRVCITSLWILTLEVYQRFLPMYN
jgi:hypothetical protein